MKALRYLLFAVLALIALYLIAGLIAPKDCHVERSINIDAPRDVVYSTLNSYASFNDWSPWAERDPNMKVTIEGTDGTAGAKYLWEGNNEVGKGSLTTISTSPDRIEQELYFDGMGSSPVYYTLKENGEQTEVAWGIDMHIPYPFNAFNLIMNPEEMLKKDYDQGLAKLKSLVEGNYATIAKYKNMVTTQDIPQRAYAGLKDVVKMSDMGKFFGESYGRLGGIMGEDIGGAPVGFYYTWDEAKGETEIAAAFPMNRKANYGDPLIDYTFMGGKALVIDYMGASEGSAAAHYGMDAYIKEQGLKTKTPVMEEYLIGADSGMPVEEHHTRIIYFLEE